MRWNRGQWRHAVRTLVLALAVGTGAVGPAPAQNVQQSYEDQLIRLSEILGALHHLRDICGAGEGQLWREQMTSILDAEQPAGQFRARLIASFNNGYRGFQRTYGTCTTSAKTAADRFFSEGSQIAATLTISLEAAGQAAADAIAEETPESPPDTDQQPN